MSDFKRLIPYTVLLYTLLFTPVPIHAQDVLIPFQENGLWGFCDLEKRAVVTPQFEDFDWVTSHLYRLKKNGKWALWDSRKKEVLTPYTYDTIFMFPYAIAHWNSNQYIYVKSNDRAGLLDTSGVTIFPPIYEDIDIEDDDAEVFRVKSDDQWGLAGTEGRPLTAPAFDWISRVIDGLMIARADSALSVLDESGRIISKQPYEPIYMRDRPYTSDGDKMWPFPAFFYDNGLILVKQAGKYGFVNRTGDQAVPCMYEEAYGFSEGLAAVQYEGRWGYIDTVGAIIVPFAYDRTMYLEYGVGVIIQNGKYGLVNARGDIILSPRYDEISEFYYSFSRHKPVAMIRQDGKRGIVDPHGRVIIPVEFDGIELTGHFHNFFIVRKNRKYGLLDSLGNTLIDISYDEIEHDINSGAESVEIWNVRFNDRWALFNEKGEQVTPFKYDKINNIQHGLIGVEAEGKHGFINILGEEVIQVVYDSSHLSASEDLVGVSMDGKWGVIDHEGQLVIPLRYDAVSTYVPFVKVTLNDKQAVFSKSGEQRTDFIYDDVSEAWFDGFIMTQLFRNKSLTKQDRKTGMLNYDGDVMLPTVFEHIYGKADHYWVVYIDGVKRVVGLNGTRYW